MVLLSTPVVQSWIAAKASKDIKENIGVDIQINRLGLNWRGEVDVRDLYIADHHNDTLIYGNELKTNLHGLRNILKGSLQLRYIDLVGAKFYLKTYEGEDQDNLSVFLEKLEGDGEPGEDPFGIFSTKVDIQALNIKIINENLDTPEVFDFQDIVLSGKDFVIKGPIIATNVEKLSFQIKDGMKVDAMKTNFKLSDTNLTFNNLDLQTSDTQLIGDVDFDFSKAGMSDFVNDVVITADLNNAKIGSNDLNTFYNGFGPNQTIILDAELKGILNDFVAHNVNFKSGNTTVLGDFTFKNLIDQNKVMAIVGNNHTIATNYFDLRRFMPEVFGNSLPEEMKNLRNFTLSGNSSLIADELKTKGDLSSEIGDATLDVKIGNLEDIDNAYYSGEIVLDKFDLGKMGDVASLGKVTGNLTVDGRGLNEDTVDTQVMGYIDSFGFEGYQYQDIELSGLFKKPLFNGAFKVDDPNLQMEFNGLIDASEAVNKLDFEANVDYADLNKMNLITRDSIAIFTGNMVVDMEGNTIDNVEGNINFNRTFYQSERDYYYFDDFTITASSEGDVRTIEINSPDILNGQISGEFLIEDTPNLFQNGVASIYANYKPKEVTTSQYITYEFEIYNKIVDVFVPQVKFGDHTRVKGTVYSDESKFELDFSSPELILFNNYIGKLDLQMDNDNPLFNTYISADSINMGFYEIKNLDVINKTLNDTMYVRAEFKGGKRKEDLFNLSLYHTINPEGKSVIGVKRSDIVYLDNEWFLNEHNDRLNKVSFDDNFSEIRIDSLVLSHQNELIQMAGVLRDSSYKDVKLRFRDVNIGHIAPEIDSLKLAGNINGKFDFLQKDGSYYPNSSVIIDDLIINDIFFGTLDLEVEGNEDLTRYDINTRLLDEDVKTINALGWIDVSGTEPKVQLDLDVEKLNLKAISPFGEDIITDIRGLVSGNVVVSGNYKSPDIRGRFNMENGGIKVPYLNVDLDLENNTTIFVSKNKLEIAGSKITDTKYGSSGVLSGYASHQNFKDWELNLNINSVDRLLVLDTPKDEDALYYGTAFVSGNISLNGPVDELLIQADATTEPGTSFKVPISEMETISDDSFVHFLSPEEKEARIKGITMASTEIKKMTLEFDLNINQNAEVEVVVDQVNNSTLKGKGSGTLLLRIDTGGKFLMYGDFVVFEGRYDFRYGGLIQRNIAVVPGGTIIWNGAPERAILDLKALYDTEANPSVLLDNPSANRKIPVEVYVGLQGELEQPELSFDIEFPRVSSTLNSELQFKLQTEEQRQNQALFLLASNSFVDDNYGGTNAFAGTVADRVSGLVNSLFADQDGKFMVGVDYSVGSNLPDQESADRFGVTVSTKVSERILINGKVGIPVGGTTETSVAGDIEVQWLMNEDGSLRMKFFNRQADLQFIGEDHIFEQGAGISYSVNFNTFQELMQKLFNRKEKRAFEDIPIVPDDSSFPIEFNSQGILMEED